MGKLFSIWKWLMDHLCIWYIQNQLNKLNNLNNNKQTPNPIKNSKVNPKINPTPLEIWWGILLWIQIWWEWEEWEDLVLIWTTNRCNKWWQIHKFVKWLKIFCLILNSWETWFKVIRCYNKWPKIILNSKLY